MGNETGEIFVLWGQSVSKSLCRTSLGLALLSCLGARAVTPAPPAWPYDKVELELDGKTVSRTAMTADIGKSGIPKRVITLKIINKGTVALAGLSVVEAADLTGPTVTDAPATIPTVPAG